MTPPDKEGAAIVMVGSFNPAIFQPLWLGAQELIRPEEASNATIFAIQSELADFSTEWFQLQALQNRFQLNSSDPSHYAPLRDLASSIFAILPHTPVKTLVLTRNFHVPMPSVDSWHEVGHLLAPKDPWSPIMKEPGLRSILVQGRRDEFDTGILQVKVEPSLKVQHGVYIEAHLEFKAPGSWEMEGAHWVRVRLAQHWDDILKFSEDAAEHLLSLLGR